MIDDRFSDAWFLGSDTAPTILGPFLARVESNSTDDHTSLYGVVESIIASYDAEKLATLMASFGTIDELVTSVQNALKLAKRAMFDSDANKIATATIADAKDAFAKLVIKLSYEYQSGAYADEVVTPPTIKRRLFSLLGSEWTARLFGSENEAHTNNSRGVSQLAIFNAISSAQGENANLLKGGDLLAGVSGGIIAEYLLTWSDVYRLFVETGDLSSVSPGTATVTPAIGYDAGSVVVGESDATSVDFTAIHLVGGVRILVAGADAAAFKLDRASDGAFGTDGIRIFPDEYEAASSGGGDPLYNTGKFTAGEAFVKFSPLEARAYNATLKFLVNGGTTVEVPITGLGTA